MGLGNLRIRSCDFQIKPIIAIVIFILLLRAFAWFQQRISSNGIVNSKQPNLCVAVRKDKFLQIPLYQKITLARDLLTARSLNQTILMPSMSASLFYKEVQLRQSMQLNNIWFWQIQFNLR